MTEISFCSKCGTQLGDDSVFCSKCGKLVNEEHPTQIRKERWGSKTPPILAYVVAILFGIIGGILVYIFERKENPTLAKRCLILGFIMFVIYFFIALSQY